MRPQIKYKPVGRKPRRSRAKPRKTQICPVCAETFKASRSDQTYCGSTCRVRAHRGSTPSNIEASAEALRERRRAARERAAEKRRLDREARSAHRVRAMVEFEAWEAATRRKLVGAKEADIERFIRETKQKRGLA